ncbi:tetraacyldisaccharide 4'-kinase, partial [Psychrosphaera sp.]|nr:tetraacyldisaccharide 4'-kinase [Psychrosphaera sp.]
VDFTVINSGFVSENEKALSSVNNEFVDYQLGASVLVALKDGKEHPLYEETRNVHLISGIGNPDRFSKTARQSGLKVISEHWFPDHHNFTESDFKSIKVQDNDIIVMTEKDAVKCMKFAKPNWYALPVDAIISQSLEKNLIEKIKKLKN